MKSEASYKPGHPGLDPQHFPDEDFTSKQYQVQSPLNQCIFDPMLGEKIREIDDFIGV